MMKISQLYVSYTSVQLKSKKKKEKLLELILQNKEMNQEEGDMGSREQETPHREESCQAREQRAGLERSRQGDTVDSQLSQHG